MAISIGMKLLGAVVKDELTLQEYFKLSLNPSLFKENELMVYEYLDEFVKTHKKVPHESTIIDSIKGFSGFPKIVENPEYYLSELNRRFTVDTLTTGIKTASKELNVLEKGKTGIDPDKAIYILQSAIREVVFLRNKKSMMLMSEAVNHVELEMKKKLLLGDEYTVKLGYSMIDDMGGLGGGDVVSYVGRPASGKTYNLLYSANYMWEVQNKSVLVFSMEMKPLDIAQRMTAIHAGVGVTGIKTGEMDSKTKSVMLDKMTEAKDLPPFYIIDGSLSVTMDDINTTIMQLDPDVVFIDGAYLIKHQNKRMNKFERIGEIAEEIKASAFNFDIPFICSYQLNRDAAAKMKKKKSDVQVDLEDIGFSDAIPQLSSIVIGFLEQDSVENMVRKKVTIMKGRNGEEGEFFINWDFIKMDFSEIVAPTLESLSYV